MSLNTMEKVVIIIPTYNEALVITETINKLISEINLIHDFVIEILIFDSASTDLTKNYVQQLQKKHKQIKLAYENEKSGLGSAYHQAMEYATNTLGADIIFEYDADGSHQPCYIKPMLNAMKNADVVVGSRYVKGGSIPGNWGFKRKLFSRLGNLVSRVVLNPKYKDYTSGFRATRVSVLKKVWPESFMSNGYAYKLQLFWLLHKAGAQIVEHPIDFIDREKGVSKLPANSIKDSLRVIFKLRFHRFQTYLKMCSVGIIGAVIQFVTYNLARFIFSPFESMQLAVSLAIVSNFILNNKVTFKASPRASSIKKLTTFILFSLAMIYSQSLWVSTSVHYFGHGVLFENLMIVLGLVIGSIFNFIFYSKVIWRDKTHA